MKTPGLIPDPTNRLEPGETWRSTLFDDLPAPTFDSELYHTAQAAGTGSTDIDVWLDEHRESFGEPEQVAHATKGDPCDVRLPLAPVAIDLESLVDRFGLPAGQRLHDYLQEHDQWRRGPSASL